MADNPLIAEPEKTASADGGALTNMGADPSDGSQLGLDDGGLNNATMGAGIFNDAAQTISDFATGQWGWAALDLAVDAMDVLGAVMDPLGTLAAAGIGWAIEHIKFLKEPLDMLAGDPAAVTAHSVTWHNISEALADAAKEYDKSVQTINPHWKGQAAAAYVNSAKGYSSVLRSASSHAQNASQAIKYAGMGVGVVRGVIRDAISTFLGDIIGGGLEALALAIPTAGASIVEWIASLVESACDLATKAASKMANLAKTLGKMSENGGKAAKALKATEGALNKVSHSIGKNAETGAARASERAASAGKTAASRSKIAAVRQSQKGLKKAKEDAKTAEASAKMAHRRAWSYDKFDEEGKARNAASVKASQKARSAQYNVDKAKEDLKDSIGGVKDSKNPFKAGAHLSGAVSKSYLADAHDWVESHHSIDHAKEAAKSKHEDDEAWERTHKAYEREHQGNTGHMKGKIPKREY